MEVDTGFLLKSLDHPVDYPLIEVFAAEERITAGGKHLEDAVAHLHDGHVKGSAAEVIDGDLLAVALAEAIGQGGRGRFIDDALDVEAGDLSGVFGCLALDVVEVGGHGDDRLGEFIAEKLFGSELESLEQYRRNLGRRVIASAHSHAAIAVWSVGYFIRTNLSSALDFRRIEFAAHQALHRIDGICRVGNGLALGNLADQSFPFFR